MYTMQSVESIRPAQSQAQRSRIAAERYALLGALRSKRRGRRSRPGRTSERNLRGGR
jgi:hypothetical protein